MSEIHVSSQARSKYQFDEDLFSKSGRIAIVDIATARRIAEKLSAHLPEPIPASELNAMGLLNEMLDILIQTMARFRYPHCITSSVREYHAEFFPGCLLNPCRF